MHFDPLNIRLARDIRNSLSKSFLRALVEKDVTVFQNCATHYLQQNLEPDFEKYVRVRLAKYEDTFALIQQQKLKEGMQQAEILWEAELYFEMHELLELDWKRAEGNRRLALQGLIRAAGMKIHAEINNMKAAASMGAKAQAALLQYKDELVDFTKVDAVLAAIKQTLTTCEKYRRED